MEKKVEIRKKIVNIVAWIVIIAVVLLSMHLLVNNLNILDFVKKIHGG